MMNEWFDREIAEKLSIRDINYLKNSNQIVSTKIRKSTKRQEMTSKKNN